MRFGNTITLLQPELTKPEDCTQLFNNISNPYVVKKSGEAIFLLNFIISECLIHKTESVKVVMKDLAEKYGVSKQTLSLWLKRLLKEGLVTKVKVDSIVKLKPAYFVNPKIIITKKAYTDLSSNSQVIMSDILHRLEKLELEYLEQEAQ